MLAEFFFTSSRIMPSAQTRALIFWTVCIPSRLVLAANSQDSHIIRAAALVIGGRWVLGLENGSIGFFGGPAWWADERALHGVLWLLYAGTGESKYLWVDTAFGAANFMM